MKETTEPPCLPPELAAATDLAAGPATAEEFCYMLLTGGELADKLRAPRRPDGTLLPLAACAEPRQVDEPARAGALRVRRGAEKLPALGQLGDPTARALCLERFAHHELQAIELFAWMVVAFPRSQVPPGLRRALLLTLEEEQTHLALYLERLAAHDWWLGRSPLSDYLWQHHEGVLRSPQPALTFLSAMGLTFEQANLDFSLLYRDGFRAAGDEASAQVLERVHKEEIRHVRVAMHWLRRLKDPAQSELSTYLSTIPFPLSAARAKGRRFDLAARQRAGLPAEFIAHVRAAQPYGPRQQERAMLYGQKRAELSLWPNLGAEEARPLPDSTQSFLRGLLGAWATLFDATAGPPLLLPPGEEETQLAWREGLQAQSAGPALPCLAGATGLVAWLGTEQAAAQAAARGCALSGPAPTIVRGVHDKAFAHHQGLALGLVPPCLRELLVDLSPSELLAADAGAQIAARVASWPAWLKGRFTLKPRLGTSGRGRVMGTGVLPPPPARRAGHPAAAGPHPALAELAARGGCLLEPWLDRVRDLSLQLYVHGDGRIEVLGSTTQLVTSSGQILGNRGVFSEGQVRSGAPAGEEEELRGAAQRLGAAAAAAGFYGVAGIDAFVFRGEDGGELLRPVVELNARFTTGTVAVGLLRRAERAGFTEGLSAWALLIKGSGVTPQSHPRELRVLAPISRGPVLVLARTPALLSDWLARSSSA